MPFSSLSDPVVTARAMAAWEAAWARIKNERILMLGSDEAEQARLKFIIASLAPMALDEDDLVARAIEHFCGKASKAAVIAEPRQQTSAS